MPNAISRYTYAQLEALWIQAGGDRASAPIMAAIAMAESGGNPTATNHNHDGSIDRGLWQINSVHGNLSTFDPMANAKAAVSIKNGPQGFSAWVTYTSGAYRQFLQNGASPDPNMPGGSTSTATGQDASLTGDLGTAIGEGLGSAFKALMQPLIATVIWGSEVALGLGLMIGGIVVFMLNTNAGRSVESGVKSIGTNAGTTVVPELSFEERVAREQELQQRRKAVRQEAARRNKSNGDSGTSNS